MSILVKSLKNRLLLAFSSITLAMFILSIVNILLAKTYAQETNDLFEQLSATTVISVKLNNSFQELSNLINYKNEAFILIVEKSNNELVDFVRRADPLIRKSAESAIDANLFYKYIDIQNLIYTYKEKSSVLAEATKHEKVRVLLYDNLYELKDLKVKINEELSALLVRQTVAVDSLFTLHSRKITAQMFFSIFTALALTVLVLMFSVRTVRKLSQPVEALAKRARRAEKGDFGTAEKPVHSYPEIDYLVDAFDSMISRIGSLIGEIEGKAALEKRLADEEISVLYSDNLLRSAELRLLQSQINPHFLFNTINTIVTLAHIEEAEFTAALLDDMARILRYSLRTTKSTTTVREELEIVRTYLRIQSTRLGNRLSTNIIASDESLSVALPSMLLQPLVENAMNHGLEPKMGPVLLEVRSSLITLQSNEKNLEIQISDNGIGMPSSILEKLRIICKDLENTGKKNTSSVKDGDHGVPNVIRRIELLYDTASISIQSNPDSGTTFIIHLPLFPKSSNS
ncbi:hypothetical protein MASR2M78_06140 [Treponema sp.]